MNVAVRSIRPPVAAIVKGPRVSVEMWTNPLTMHYRVDADRFPADSEFRIAFYTVVPEYTMQYQMCKRYPESFSSTDAGSGCSGRRRERRGQQFPHGGG